MWASASARAALTGLLLLTGFPAMSQDRDPGQRPIVFVHGNGDSAALWHTTIWRFESNGYDRARLFAIDMPHPAAPGRDSIPEENRSSTVDQASQLAAFVARVLLETGQEKVVLVGSSRGGNTIRNYVKRAGGHVVTALAVLCGTPNHGVVARSEERDSEWSGTGNFLTALNADTEVHPDVPFVTLRSDTNDKFAQPRGPYVGPNGAGYASPALRGATNVVLDGLDHREVAFHPRAFKEIYRAIVGKAPARLDIVPEEIATLDGVVSGYANGEFTNLPLEGARVRVYDLEPESGARRGDAVHDRTTAADGRWGPFGAANDVFYEIVVEAEGYPVTHVYRTPFPRSSRYVHLRLAPLEVGADGKPDAGSLVTMTRPRGYLGHGRDVFTIDGAVPDGVAEGVPGSATATVAFEASPQRSVRVVLNEETVVVRTWPLAEGHLTLAEFHF